MESETSIARDAPADHIREEFERRQKQFDAQPAIVQRFLEAQGAQLANALIDPPVQVRFSLPDRIVMDAVLGALAPAPVAQKFRAQTVGRFLFDRITKQN